MDEMPLGTNPPVCKGDVVRVIKDTEAVVFAKHKRKKIKLHKSNFNNGFFRPV